MTSTTTTKHHHEITASVETMKALERTIERLTAEWLELGNQMMFAHHSILGALRAERHAVNYQITVHKALRDELAGRA